MNEIYERIVIFEFEVYRRGYVIIRVDEERFIYPRWFHFPLHFSNILEDKYSKPVFHDFVVCVFQFHEGYRTKYETDISKYLKVNEDDGRYFAKLVCDYVFDKFMTELSAFISDYSSVFVESDDTYDIIQGARKWLQLHAGVIDEITNTLSDILRKERQRI